MSPVLLGVLGSEPGLRPKDVGASGWPSFSVLVAVGPAGPAPGLTCTFDGAAPVRPACPPGLRDQQRARSEGAPSLCSLRLQRRHPQDKEACDVGLIAGLGPRCSCGLITSTLPVTPARHHLMTRKNKSNEGLDTACHSTREP